jgi:uncharacterized membrane protein
MHNPKHLFEKLFLAVSSLAALFVLTEIIMQAFGKSICFSEGCRLTAQYTRFGDLSILLIGFAAFATMAALSFLARFYYSTSLANRLLNLVLVVALTGEGFFMGYLMFRIQTVCVFCLIVFGCMVTLGILRILSGQREVIAGFAALTAVFSLLYLVLPVGITVNLPAENRLILFYSKDCRHCTEVIKEFEEKKIAVAHLPVNEYANFLKSMGIDHVPTLLVNDPNQKVFLTGKEAILRYLLACTTSNKDASGAGPKPPAAKRKEAPVAKGQPLIPDIFSQPGLLTVPDSAAADDGMCKEDQICK